MKQFPAINLAARSLWKVVGTQLQLWLLANVLSSCSEQLELAIVAWLKIIYIIANWKLY